MALKSEKEALDAKLKDAEARLSKSDELLQQRDSEIVRLNNELPVKAAAKFAQGYQVLVDQIKVVHPSFDFSPFGMRKRVVDNAVVGPDTPAVNDESDGEDSGDEETEDEG